MDLIAAKLGANMAKNDLTANGQIGYVANEMKELFTCPGPLFPEDKFDGIFWYLETGNGPFLESGKTYRVVMGTEVCTVACEENGYGGRFLHAFLTTDNTGIAHPLFQYSEQYYNGEFISAECVNSCGLPCTVEGEAEVIQPVDPKYLPNPADIPASWIADLKTALGIA